jgi:hypothetical protein
MAAGVVAGIVQGDVREGHVADSQVEVPGRQLGVGKVLGPDGGPGIEGLGDGRGGRIQLHAGHLGGVRGEPHEGAHTGPRFKDRAPR